MKKRHLLTVAEAVVDACRQRKVLTRVPRVLRIKQALDVIRLLRLDGCCVTGTKKKHRLSEQRRGPPGVLLKRSPT